MKPAQTKKEATWPLFYQNKFVFPSNKMYQIIISWEKQKTPSRPPFRVLSNTLPESATCQNKF